MLKIWRLWNTKTLQVVMHDQNMHWLHKHQNALVGIIVISVHLPMQHTVPSFIEFSQFYHHCDSIQDLRFSLPGLILKMHSGYPGPLWGVLEGTFALNMFTNGNYCMAPQTNYTARWISTKPCAGDGSRVSPINYGITPLWPSDPEMLAWSSEWEYNAFLLPLHSYIALHRRFTATLFSEILYTEITAKKQSAMLWTKHDGAQTWVIEDKKTRQVPSV